MRSRAGALLVLAASACVLVAWSAPGNSRSSRRAGVQTVASSRTGHSYTIGLLTDVTGLGASADASSVPGVEAGIVAARQQGYDFKLVVADTQTSPTGTLSAAEKLVEVDHVIAVVAISGLTFAASSFLTSHGVPVVGSPQDGTEWLDSKNMFSVFGLNDATKTATTFGDFLKLEGIKNVGTLGYGIEPLSAAAPKQYAASAQAVGIRAGYVNPQFQYGSTNVAPVALAMKSAGVDAVITAVEPNTGLSLITALRQDGVKLKVALLATGYGGDLTQGGPGAVQSAQGVDFYLVYEPVEMHTPATIKLQNALRKAGVKGAPTFAEYQGYASVDAIVLGLRGAGPDPTHASLIHGLARVHDFNAAGLLGSHTVDFGSRTPNVFGPGNCLYMTKLVGTSFELVSGADPICGKEVHAKTIPLSS